MTGDISDIRFHVVTRHLSVTSRSVSMFPRSLGKELLKRARTEPRNAGEDRNSTKHQNTRVPD